MIRFSSTIVLVLALTVPAAAEVSKEACVTAHGRAQDANDQGKLSLARKLYLTCAQSSCPALVRDDCSRGVDELARLLPTLTFAARDRSSADLPDTTVYVDDILTATRLDDGRPYEVDPGKHSVKFVHGGDDQVVTIVVGAGEKGRSVVATFGSREPPPRAVPPRSVPDVSRAVRNQAPPAPARTGPKVVLAIGGVVALSGVALTVIGLARLPSQCEVSTHECAASPGDPVFAQAGRAMRLSNLGMVTAAVGVTAFTGGVVWYLTAEPTRKERRLVAPWITPDSAGLAASGSF